MTQTPILDACHCGDDPQLQLLRDLISRNVAVRDASLISFGHAPRAAAPVEVHRLAAKVALRRTVNATRAELGMPLLPTTLKSIEPPPLVIEIVADVRPFVAAMRRFVRASAAMNVHLAGINDAMRAAAANEARAAQAVTVARAAR